MRAAKWEAGAGPRAGGPAGGRRGARGLPWLVLALWIGVLAVAVPLAGRLGDVQRDSVVDYLPASADSTQVAKVQQELPGGESTDLVVVYHRDGGLTAADRRTAAGQTADLARTFRLTGGAAAPEGVPSKDGTTLMYPVSSTQPGEDSDAKTTFVDGVRDIATGGHGLTVKVGGPGGLDADASEVYSSLGGPLLYTTVLVVAVLLILIYRSPALWLVPLFAAGAADVLSMAVTYLLNRAFGITVSGQSSGVMTILVFGVGTDYALLLVARYREELRGTARPYDAMRTALRRCAPAITASAGTVAAGMLCLLAADLNSSHGMGPAAAVGVASALAAMVTLLPALLVLLGRRVFWPLVPEPGSEPRPPRRGGFDAIGRLVGRRPVAVLMSGVVLLGALALGVLHLPGSLKQQDSFATKPDSIAAAQLLGAAYPDRSGQPITVVSHTGAASAAERTARGTVGVVTVRPGRTGGGWSEFFVTAAGPPQSAAETATIRRLRAELHGSYVGGPSAQQIDLRSTNSRDREIVVPITLAAIVLILILLLRSLVAPLLLAAAVIAVWGSALGVGGLVFGPVLGFHGTDPGLGLLSFVFLVALGVDYGIFLMHRMREEALNGAPPRQATLSALRTTGGVITSAGIVLAATFSVLVNMPLVQLAELGFVIAVGVLLDTFVVRTFLVTSASMLLGRRLWAPGALGRARPPAAGEDGGNGPDDTAAVGRSGGDGVEREAPATR
ncbi:putative drug exporter of the RND superfamily [Actinacidiphila yanglinensis]|uniref:Putative drug exporter of the RND superfamily n=1 Tax=Actinacidiphila yanglinensis TaxID=310779 RepID=A0A1H6B6J5_9ACTN|nr:MMPL family transporter [Actinacidiphila yanglinensis]SEG56459.1 putative drug exporter of the RND superfamily [Actinacidiphila yanglinensis]